MLAEFEELIGESLSTYTSVEVTRGDQNGSPPTYPFIRLHSHSLLPEVGLPIEELNVVPSADVSFTYDLEQKLITMPKVRLTITSHSAQQSQSQALALKAHEWFYHRGYTDLRDRGIIVVKVDKIENHAVLLEEGYEYRSIFEVLLRVKQESKLIQPTIEKIQFSVKE